MERVESFRKYSYGFYFWTKRKKATLWTLLQWDHGMLVKPAEIMQTTACSDQNELKILRLNFRTCMGLLLTVTIQNTVI